MLVDTVSDFTQQLTFEKLFLKCWYVHYFHRADIPTNWMA